MIGLGLILLIAGLAWPWVIRMGLGHLPRDIRVERPAFSFIFPLASSIRVSIVLSLTLTLIAWFWRR